MKRGNVIGALLKGAAWTVIWALAAVGLPAKQVVTFELLGDPPMDMDVSPIDVSSDGSIITGRIFNQFDRAVFIWEDGVYYELPESHSPLFGPILSDDGDHVVSVGNDDIYNWSEYARKWDFSPAEGWIKTELPVRNETTYEVSAVSGGGEIVVGTAHYGASSINEACYWKQGRTSMAIWGLGFSDFGGRESHAYDISANGSVIVGSDNTGGGNNYIPVQWINGQISILPKLPGSEDEACSAVKVSADGSHILGFVGSVWRPAKIILWRDGVPELVMDNPEHLLFRDVSGDMKSMVMDAGDLMYEGSYYGTQGTGWNLVHLNDFLDYNGIDREGKSLYATAISEDGSTIVGLAYKELGGDIWEGTPFRIQIINQYGPYGIRTDGYCDTGDWSGWLWVENDPWVWSSSMDHWLYCPGENVSESGAWVYMLK